MRRWRAAIRQRRAGRSSIVDALLRRARAVRGVGDRAAAGCVECDFFLLLSELQISTGTTARGRFMTRIERGEAPGRRGGATRRRMRARATQPRAVGAVGAGRAAGLCPRCLCLILIAYGYAPRGIVEPRPGRWRHTLDILAMGCGPGHATLDSRTRYATCKMCGRPATGPTHSIRP
jgi:hypothetical protein